MQRKTELNCTNQCTMSVLTPNSTPRIARVQDRETKASTPTVVPLVPVPSHDLIKKYQQTLQQICQQYVDDDGWGVEKQHVLSEVFNKFAHNVFATIRKNITLSTKRVESTHEGLVEPLDRELVSKVQSLDAELDQVTARVEQLRQEVPQMLTEKNMEDVKPNITTSTDGLIKAAKFSSSIGNVLSHVANEVKVFSSEFKDIRHDLRKAVDDCTSTVKVIKKTLEKPRSSTQQVFKTLVMIKMCDIFCCLCFH